MPLTLPPHDMPLSPLFKRFAFIYLPIVLVFSIAVFASIWVDDQRRIERVSAREDARIAIARDVVAQDLTAALSDLRLVTQLPLLKRYLDGGPAAPSDQMSDYFLALAAETDRYVQLRYLDKYGHELVRVDYDNGKGVLVPPGSSRGNLHRGYINETLKLAAGEIYVSPMELNIERDQTERPHKPVIRLGTPVFDSAGDKKGMVLLDYAGARLQQRFREAMEGGDPHSAMLLNRDGYWLSSPEPEGEWGDALGRPDRTLARASPEVWRVLVANDRGALRTSQGLFVYTTVHPLAYAARAPASGGRTIPIPSLARGYYWKLVSFVPHNVLFSASFYNQTWGRALFALTYVLLAVVSWTLAAVTLRRKRAEEALSKTYEEIEDLYDHAPCGYHSLDGDGLIVRINQTELTWLGYQREEVMGKMHFTALLTPQGQETFRESFSRFKEQGEVHDLEFELVRKDGSSFPVLLNATAARDTQGGFVMSRSTLFDLTERKRFELELARQARIDVLTGLINRRYFFELAERELTRSKRHVQDFAVLMLDVDHFKFINDNYGHDAGDEVLRKLSKVCGQTLREIDIVGRIGGEELAALLPGATCVQAMAAAERLRLAIQSTLVSLQAHAVQFTVSIGVTSLMPNDEGVDELLKRADEALYRAKRGGRNRVCSDEMSAV